MLYALISWGVRDSWHEARGTVAPLLEQAIRLATFALHCCLHITASIADTYQSYTDPMPMLVPSILFCESRYRSLFIRARGQRRTTPRLFGRSQNVQAYQTECTKMDDRSLYHPAPIQLLSGDRSPARDHAISPNLILESFEP